MASIPNDLPIEIKRGSGSRSAAVVNRLASSSVWVIVASFGTYFCMYGFRKPYTAATWHAQFWGFDYKFLMVISQTSGYVLSKWLGIKIVSEVSPARRIRVLFMLIAIAQVMLLMFSLTPRPWNIVFMFLNGIPLGVVFGLVLGFLEGRTKTELLIAGLCTSFIVADGVSKSAGTFLLGLGVPENWMPFFTGVLFLPPTALFIGMLRLVPPPNGEDVAERSARLPMFHQQRKDFFLRFAPGIIGITIAYLLVTLLRSLRADFAPELWAGLGYSGGPLLFTQTEVIISVIVLLFNSFTFLIKDHRSAMRFSLLVSLLGFIMILISVVGFLNGLSGFVFVVLTGLGVYLPYVAIHTTVFERMIAITKERANIGFLMYIVDSVGYTGYIILLFFSNFFTSKGNIADHLVWINTVVGLCGVVTISYCQYYFKNKLKPNE